MRLESNWIADQFIEIKWDFYFCLFWLWWTKTNRVCWIGSWRIRSRNITNNWSTRRGCSTIWVVVPTRHLKRQYRANHFMHEIDSRLHPATRSRMTSLQVGAPWVNAHSISINVKVRRLIWWLIINNFWIANVSEK